MNESARKADDDWAREALRQLLARVRKAVSAEYARRALDLWG